MVFKPQTFHGEPPVVHADHETENTLEQQVADLLATSDGIDASDVRVTEDAGAIVLSGHVSQPSEIDRAVEIAWSVAGVRSVGLKLRVSPPLAAWKGAILGDRTL